MPSGEDNSFARILGRHAAGAGDSQSSGGSKPKKAQKAEKADEKPSASPAAKWKPKRKPKSPKSAPAKKAKTSGKSSGGGSRRGGKRSDPDYTHVTVLLHKDLIRRLKLAKVLQDRDMSDIVAEALEEALPPE